MMDSDNNSAIVKTPKPKIQSKAINAGKPSAAEINALANAFNQNLIPVAEELAGSMTQHFPTHGFGWKVLGAIYQQQGLLDLALKALQLAVELLPQDSEAHYNLGNCFYDQLQLDAAASSYQKAIKLKPNFARAQYNLGSVLKDQGLFSTAVAHYKKALKIDPNNVPMNFNLALMLYEQGDFLAAIHYYQQGLELQPDSDSALVILGASFKALSELDKAQECYQKALHFNPKNLDAHNNLGIVYEALGRQAEAESCYRTAIAMDPKYATAYNNLGILLDAKGLVLEAESNYKKALEIDPLRSVSYNNLAVIYRGQGRLLQSEAYCMSAIKIKPDFADAYNNLGLALDGMGRFPEAESAYNKALEYDPTNTPVLSNLSITLNSLSKLSEAEACLKKAIDLSPNFVNAHINLCSNYLAQGRVQEAEAICLKALQLQPNSVPARNNLLFLMNYSTNYSINDCLDQARQYGVVVAAKVDARFVSRKHQSQPKRLRVGFVSGDMRRHAVSCFLENYLQHADFSNVELIAYSTDSREDEVTARLKPHFSGWKSLVGLSDKDAARLIHDDGIHVLLDLSGHSSGNRLSVFAWKPAPVQVSWLGYFATTGLDAMDYFIADEMGVPESNRGQFVEKIKYLADTRICFTAPVVAIEVSSLPAIANGFITFGCFQNMAKVRDEVLDLWAEVMNASPNSKLRWQCKSFRDVSVVNELKKRMLDHGVTSDRIVLVGPTLRDAYLAAHAEVDVILDTFPFTGGTTTCEALWMGVPTLTLAGNTLIARQGASLLSAAGLADWVAETKADYVTKALAFTCDFERLASLRAGLRKQVLASPLFDAQRFASNMEKALWEMWNDIQQLDPKRKQRQVKTKMVISKVIDEKTNISLNLSVEIVSATRFSEIDFWQQSALGLSLHRHLKQDVRLSAKIAFENSRGLSEVFNDCIDEADNDAILVFMHDDVWIDEANIVDAIIAGLKHYDVIGVAGNRRRLPNQPAWAFIDSQFTWDDESNLSGCIAHGTNAFGKMEMFGALPVKCELLDGVFIATKKGSLMHHKVRFDPQFDFHFYDMDFCRTASQSGLTLGTWSVALTHQSAGAFGSKHWREKYAIYLNKWEAASGQSSKSLPPHQTTQCEQDLQVAMNEVLRMAIEQQQKGEVEQAKNLYLEILNVQPKHAEANHNLGVIEAQLGDALAALPRFELAVQVRPENEQHWVSYIDALMHSGATDAVLDAIELGTKYGLSHETAEMLAAEFIRTPEPLMTSMPDADSDTSFGVHIHQIYYSEQTQRDNDPGFIGLNNLKNERPDWREYWPIRNYLLNTSLNENDYYGFFSPKFKAKTNLDAAVVHAFVRAHEAEADVFLFSPFFDQGAFFLNIFEQGASNHADIWDVFQGCAALIAPSVDLVKLVMDSRNVVFCNYFVAKPEFWRLWLESCELIFSEAEANKTLLAVSLNASTNYNNGAAPKKVFVIERIASLLLSTHKSWKVKAFSSRQLPYANTKASQYLLELAQMDDLKIEHAPHEYAYFLSKFMRVRQSIIDKMELANIREMAQSPAEMLQIALQHQNSGQIEQAENLYLEILNIEPNHAAANHNLGVIEAKLKGVLAALPRLELAVQEKPEIEQYWVSYIDALMQSGSVDTAVNALESGQKFGLRSETAQMLAAEFVIQMEQKQQGDKLLPVTGTGGIEMLITLIPAYKTQYVIELLLSLSTQTYKNFKVIISDDSPNGEVTALIRQPQFAPLLKKLNLDVIEGPKQGSFANVVNLLNRWNQSTPYVHILFDDDLIYPTFYQQHLTAHAKGGIGTSVSYRWVGNEFGVPISSPVVPAFLGESDASVELLNSDQLFQTIVPDCNNWLGEFSNTVFSADVILKIKAQSLNGISYYGLGDVGLLLQGSLLSNTAVIKEHLGVFRMNPHQNTGNFSSISFRCAYLAWIALALSSYELGKIDVIQAKRAIDKISAVINHHFEGVDQMLDFVRLQESCEVGSEHYKLSFCKIWDEILNQDSGWVTANNLALTPIIVAGLNHEVQT